MKKYIKRLICYVITIIIISTFNTVAYANTENIEPAGDSMAPSFISEEQQKNDILNDKNLTKKEKQYHINRLESNHMLDTTNSNYSLITASPIYAATLSVPYFKQEQRYYCGPATTKQSMHYLIKSSPSQASIASDLGTTTDGTDGLQIVKYLNNNTSYHYIVSSGSDKESMRMNIFYAMTETKAPPVLRLKFSQGGSWRYSTNGHFMNASGINDGGSRIRVTDPFIGWIDPSSTGSYYVTMDELHLATTNHFANHYYW